MTQQHQTGGDPRLTFSRRTDLSRASAASREGPRWVAAISSVLVLALTLLPACIAPQADAQRNAPPPAFWLDRIVAPGGTLVFEGASTRMVLAREDSVVRFEVQPALLPVPRFVMRGDAPTLATDSFRPGWTELLYTSPAAPPYRVRVAYPRRAWEFAATQPGEAGSVTWFMPSRAKTDAFDDVLHAHWSPLHLVLRALGPLPAGETKLLALHKRGRDYFAAIDATADGRRVLRFPVALLWSDWSDANLAETCEFAVESIDRWPATTVRMLNFSRRGPATVTYRKAARPATQPGAK